MADAQYIIDIAANMPEGAATIAELDSLTASLTGAGKRSDDFQSAIKRVSEQLDVAKASSVAANAALAEGSDQYRILEREALRASKALETAQSRGRFDMRAALNAEQANSALKAYAGTLKSLEAESQRAGAEQSKLASQLKNVEKIAAHVDTRNAAVNQRFEKMGQAIKLLPGPLQGVAHNMLDTARGSQALNVSFGQSGAAALLAAGALAAVVVAVIAVSAAMVAGYVAAAGYAIGLADAARSAALSREALAALSPETAAAVGAFDAITAATGLTDAQLGALTKSLRDAKVSADNMPSALRAAALAERALGQGGASDFVARIKEGTLAVGDFADEARAKFGGIVARQMLGLDAQAERFKRLWGALFSGLDLEPILRGLDTLVGAFEKGSPLAQAFGAAVSGIFDPISRNAEQAAFAVEAFALGFAIELTKVYLAVRPAVKWLGDFFDLDGSTLLSTMKTLGEVFAVVAVVGAVAMASLVAVVGGAFAFMASAVAVPVAVVGFLIASLVTGVQTIAELIPQMVQLGADLLNGLATGITSAVTAVVGAVTGAVTQAIDTAKSILGIASPSKVFAEIGTNTVEGFTGGVEDGTGDAQGSMAALVASSPAVAQGGQSTPAPAPAGKGGGKSFDFAGATFVFRDAETAERARDQFARFMTDLLEDDATSLAGAAV